MPQKDAEEIKRKILSILREKGPSLPIQIANGVGLNMLFASAFLSELLNEREIKMTNMRVGSSPVYFLKGQEAGLEKYATYLKSKEKEAYELLRQNKFLVDQEQLPAIRVALRAIKDFAVPLQNIEGVWRYFLIDEGSYAREEIKEKEAPKEVEEKEQTIILEKQELKEDNQEALEEQETEEKIDSKENNSEESELPFEEKVREKLNKLKVKIVEETQIKKKEFYGIGRIETSIGEIEIIIVGKDKKSVNDKDLEKLYNQVIEQKKQILFLCTGEIAKKTKEVYRTYKNTILFQKID